MNEEIRELDCVALLNDLPTAGLSKGQTGAVVLVHNGGEAFEVEFPTGARESNILTVKREDLLRLRGLEYSTAAGWARSESIPPKKCHADAAPTPRVVWGRGLSRSEPSFARRDRSRRMLQADFSKRRG